MPITGLSAEVKAEVIRLRRSGLSMTKTARQLGITRGQVAGVLFRAHETKPKGTPTETESARRRVLHSGPRNGD